VSKFLFDIYFFVSHFQVSHCFCFVAKRFEYIGRYNALRANLTVEDRPVGKIAVTKVFNHTSKKLEVLTTPLEFPVYAGDFLHGEPNSGEFVQFDIHLKTIHYLDRRRCQQRGKEMVAFNVCKRQSEERFDMKNTLLGIPYL
jgi:hypothetical protein